MEQDVNIFPIFYFPPISYFKDWIKSKEIELEKWENFQKQTYRNRCKILGPNGVQKLIIPTLHNGTRLYKDIQISYSENWQKEHIKSLEAAYRRSPYFEFYEDDIIPLLESKEKFLLDFNFKILEQLLSILQIENEIRFTTQYKSEYLYDYRDSFNAKKEQSVNMDSYSQVFNDRFSFQPNLSILDLLFNLGPEAIIYLNQ